MGVIWIAVRPPSAVPPPAPVPSPAPALATLRVEVMAEGEAVEGAQVAATGPEDFETSAETDENGQAYLDCPRGRLAVSILSPGLERAQRTVELDRREGRLRVELAPGAFLRGEVKDEAGQPIAGATLLARVIGDSAIRSQDPWTVATDDAGQFQFDTLPLARVTVEVSDAGMFETAVVPEVTLPDETPLAIVLRRMAVVSGKVVQSPGGDVAGAVVTLAGSGVWPVRTATSGGHGEFRFPGVPAGIYELRAERPGLASAPVEGVSVSSGNEAQVELVVTAASNWRGSVRDIATGAPLAGAEIEATEEALSATPRRARADAAGRFELESLRACQYRITARAPGYVSAQSWATPGPPALELSLLRAAVVEGKVQDDTGRPVAGVEIEVSGRSETGYAVRMIGPINEPLGSSMPGVVGDNLGVMSGAVPPVPIAPSGALDLGAPLPDLGLGSFRTDARGAFKLEGIPPGEFTLAGRKRGYGTGRSEKLRAQAGETLDAVVLVLPRGAPLRGRVVDARRAPVEHVRVELAAPGEPARSTVSDDTGSFSFEGARAPATLGPRPSMFSAPASLRVEGRPFRTIATRVLSATRSR